MRYLNRNRVLRDNLATYFSTGHVAVDTFLSGIRHYLAHGPEQLGEYATPSHLQESACDAIRFRIEEDLFEKSLMPALREDIMLLLEAVDDVINQSEDVLRQIFIQRIVLPDLLKERFGDLAGVCHEAATILLQQGEKALGHDSHAREYRDRIDALESDADRLEQGMIGDLFRADIPLPEKLLARDVIAQVSHLADLAEDAANFVLLFRLKREI